MRVVAVVFLLFFFGMFLVYQGIIEFPPKFGLSKVVQDSLKGAKGEYAVAVKNLKTGESYSLNADKVFETGSLYKLWVMAEAFRQIEGGELREDEVLSAEIADLNKTFKISSESAELEKGVISLPVKTAIKQMITISHNYAALLLAERIRHSKITDFLKDYGFNNSKLGGEEESPTSTVSDMLFFFEKLYKGEFANSQNTQKMLSILKDQRLNDKLPKYLPKNVQIAHKTGEIGFFSHDAGIVYSKKSEYVIVVFSQSDYPPEAEERIARISQAVYNYFQGKISLPKLQKLDFLVL